MRRSTVLPAIGLLATAICSSLFASAVINVPELEWDFGAAPQQSVVSHEYWIKNIGDDTLRNIVVKPGCGCTLAPVRKNTLAPGESTVVELIFNTGLMKGKVAKSASILSSDSARAKIVISFRANVFSPADTSVRFIVNPERIEFDQKTRKIKAELANKGTEEISLRPLAGIIDQLKVKIKNDKVAPSQSGLIEFEWKGDFPENDLKKTVTFEIEGSTINRLSVPVVVRGTSPQPEPGKAAKQTQQNNPTTLQNALKSPGGEKEKKTSDK